MDLCNLILFKLKPQKKKTEITCTLIYILAPCREMSSLPEQVKQLFNLSDYYIQFKNLTMLKKKTTFGFILCTQLTFAVLLGPNVK